MVIGEKIKSLRTSQGLTQDELADAAGTTKQTIHKYETGIIQNIPASKVKAIADKLNTTPAYLMGWESDNGSIGSNIKSLRESNNITQKELADAIGVTDKAVSTWELDIKTPRMGSIQRIADYFGVKKSDIIEDKNSANKNDDRPLTPEEALEKLKQGRKNTFVLMGHGGSGGHDVIRMNEDEFNAVKSVLETMRKNQQQRNKKQSKE